MINTLRLTHLIYLGWVGPEDGQCRPKHVAPPNLNKLDVLDVKCLSFNVVYQAGVLGGPHGFFVISQLLDAVDYSNYVFWVSEAIIQ